MRCLLPPSAPRHWCDIRRRTVLVAAPAAGVDWSVPVPVAEAWLVYGMRATLTTAAAVATREVALQVAMAGVVRATYKSSRQQTAGLVADYGLVPGGPAGLDATLATGAVGVPDDFILEPGSVLQVATAALQAADQWSNIALDVVFELNRGEGAAREYMEWRQSQADAPAPAPIAGAPSSSPYQ